MTTLRYTLGHRLRFLRGAWRCTPLEVATIHLSLTSYRLGQLASEEGLPLNVLALQALLITGHRRGVSTEIGSAYG